MRRIASIASCLLVVALAGAARAEDSADAMIARGVELREKGRDEEALALFKKAYDKTPSPRARAQVALAEQALGMWVAAEADLVAALDASSDPWIVTNKVALEGALGVIRRHVGGLEVRGADGAEVRVDGVVVGTASPKTAFRVEAGKRTLELRVEGHHPTTRTIEVPAGGVARETVTLVAVSHDEGGGDSSSLRPREPREDFGPTQRLLGWTFAGTGGALLVTGGVGIVIREGLVLDYNADPECPGIGKPQSASCQNQVDAQRTWLTVSAISLVAGGAFAIGGILLLVTAPRRSDRSSAAGFHCTFGGCGGTF